MAFEIPLRLLPLRATVKRYSNATGEYDNIVYTDLPGRIALHRDSYFQDQAHVSSEVEHTIWICNFYFAGNKVDLRFEDQLHIDGHVYRILKVSDAESANHHFEARIDQLKTPKTEA